MRILRASHLGMCFGVRRAIARAEAEARARPLSVLGELVHNEAVLAALRSLGVALVHDPAELATPAVMITAHGASERTIRALRARGLEVIEGTCPLVRRAHRALQQLVREGCHPLVIGQREHVEVRGLTGDFAECDVVASEEDVARLRPRPRFGVVAQTTQPLDRVRRLVGLIRERFPASEVRFADTVCWPSKQRQAAAAALARRCEVVLVIGGVRSNNTRELAATCERFCRRVHHVQAAANLRPEWFEGCARVGLTAGTSTPDWVIEEVERWLRALDQDRRRVSHAEVRSEREETRPPSNRSSLPPIGGEGGGEGVRDGGTNPPAPRPAAPVQSPKHPCPVLTS